MKKTHKTIPILDKMSPNDKERFWAKVDIKSPSECWRWKDSLNPDGYGHFSVGGRNNQSKLTAHRVAKTLSEGKEIPDGSILMHVCDNPPCCNPNHLVVGTHQDNMDDMVAKKRSVKTFAAAKLDWYTVDCIRSTNMSNNWWAKELGMANSTISQIRNYKSWREEDRR